MNTEYLNEALKYPRIKEWALAIQQHEGWYEGSRSWRNNNPGNINYQPSSFSLGTLGAIGIEEPNVHGSQRFAKFATYEDGLNGLMIMLWRAAAGKSSTYNPDMTLLDFYNTYAPTKDGNYPLNYATHVGQIMNVSPIITPISSFLDEKAQPVPSTDNFYEKSFEAVMRKFGYYERGKEKFGEKLTDDEVRLAVIDLASQLEENEEYTKLYLPFDYTHLGYDFLDWTGSVFHPGVDFNKGAPNADLGEPIKNMADGTVTHISYANGWGWHMHIVHILNHKKYGKVKVWTHHAHMKEHPPVSVGQNVKGGSVIGYVGKTGSVTAPHDHEELKKKPVGVNFYPYGKSKQWVEEHYYDVVEFVKSNQ